jgi:rod shape-determining protein MreD
MKHGSLFYRWVFYGAAAGLCLILQSLLLNRLRLWGIHPFLPPVLIAVAAAQEDRQEGLCAGAVFGLVCDLTLSPVVPCFYALTFALTAFLAGLMAKQLIVPGFFCGLCASILALVVNGAFHALFLTYRGIGNLSAAAAITGCELLLTAPLIPLVYLLFRPIHRRFQAE